MEASFKPAYNQKTQQWRIQDNWLTLPDGATAIDLCQLTEATFIFVRHHSFKKSRYHRSGVNYFVLRTDRNACAIKCGATERFDMHNYLVLVSEVMSALKSCTPNLQIEWIKEYSDNARDQWGRKLKLSILADQLADASLFFGIIVFPIIGAILIIWIVLDLGQPLYILIVILAIALSFIGFVNSTKSDKQAVQHTPLLNPPRCRVQLPNSAKVSIEAFALFLSLEYEAHFNSMAALQARYGQKLAPQRDPEWL